MKRLAALRASIDVPEAAPVRAFLNQPQRVNAIGGGQAVATWNAAPVARHNIEAAAREGYLDALSECGFSRHYDNAPAPWQRNYEIGRLWATGMRVCGIEAPDWPEHMKSTPREITDAVAEVSQQIGALRPEIEGIQAPSDNLPVLHAPMRMPSRRRR